ncbi:MAG: hypothetical protein HKO72_07190 [Flavobacteriaceae bacterium]|nr:hypothetical protein [Bacteroidia bacterium]NNL61104.1 hypothetical protein [Flavobacteriaceae bacterium]
MAKNLIKAILGIFLLFSVSSCNNDDGGGNITVTPFTLTIDGQQYLPTSIPSAQLSNSGRFMIISAVNTVTDQNITISIGDSTGNSSELTTASYPIDNTDDTSIAYFVNNSTYMTDGSGQVTITTLNTSARTVSGTFQGTVTGTFGTVGTFTLANGEFMDIPYSVQ